MIDNPIVDCIKANTNFLEKHFLIKFQCDFIESVSPISNLYIDISPFRNIFFDKDNVDTSEINVKPTICLGDYYGTIKLPLTLFSWPVFLPNTREYLYEAIFNNKSGIGDKQSLPIREELLNLISIWRYDFDRDYLGIDAQAALLHECYQSVDTDKYPFLNAVISFLIQHEVGHLLYNISVKDIYNGKKQSKEWDDPFKLKGLEDFAKKYAIDQQEGWIEELVADLFAMQVCSYIDCNYTQIPSCYLRIYGIAFVFILILINIKYIKSVGMSSPETHPDVHTRLTILDRFTDAINTGRNQNGYLQTKTYLKRSKETLLFIDNLLTEA